MKTLNTVALIGETITVTDPKIRDLKFVNAKIEEIEFGKNFVSYVTRHEDDGRLYRHGEAEVIGLNKRDFKQIETMFVPDDKVFRAASMTAKVLSGDDIYEDTVVGVIMNNDGLFYKFGDTFCLGLNHTEFI